MLSIRYLESTHLIAMFPCSNLSKPPHYLQHQGHTFKPDILHPVWFDPWQTLRSQLLQCPQTYSSLWPYLVVQIPRSGRAIL